MARLLKYDVSTDLKLKKNNNYSINPENTGAYLDVKILDDGKIYDLTGKTVRAYILKDDGNIVYVDCKIEANNNEIKCILDVTTQMLKAKTLTIQFLITDEDGSTVITNPIYIGLGDAIVDTEAIESTSEFSALTEALANLTQIENYKRKLNKLENVTIPSLESQIGQGISNDQIKAAVQSKVDSGEIASMTLADNSVDGEVLKDYAVTSAKINGEINNLITEIAVDKTIDTTTGELKDEIGTYVTNAIQVRNEQGEIYKNLYINKWKNRLLWVGYGSDGTTVVKSGLGGTSTGLTRKITVGSFSSVYYVRIVGYTDLCPSSDFSVTNEEFKEIDWLRLNENNFTNALPGYLCNSNICTLRSDDSISINITQATDDSENSVISLNTNKTVMAYVNNVSTQVATNGFTLTKTVGTGNYALIYNINSKELQIVNMTELINYKCSVVCYLYIYKQSSVNCYLLGNESKINVTWTHTVTDSTTSTDYEVTDNIIDNNLDDAFTHNIKASSENWLNVNRVGIDRYATPYPFIFNSTVKAEGGMLVAQAGDCSMYNNMDNNLGGHVLQLWARNNEYRATGIIDERLPDNLPMFTLQSWITKGLSGGGSNCAYGWIKLGTDDFRIVDEVQTTEKTGVYIHPKVSIFATPVIMEAKPLLQSMPIGYEINEDGTYKLDEENHRIKIDTTSLDPSTKLGKHYDISNKNILQVNEDNELCFHSAKDNKWYKLNMTEITE